MSFAVDIMRCTIKSSALTHGRAALVVTLVTNIMLAIPSQATGTVFPDNIVAIFATLMNVTIIITVRTVVRLFTQVST